MAGKLKLVLEESLDLICSTIRGTSDKATSAANAVLALADATNKSLGEVEEILNDMAHDLVTATLPVEGWVTNTDADSKAAGYAVMYTLAAEKATENDGADVTVLPASEGTAVACGLCPSIAVLDKSIVFYSVVAPTAAIAIQYTLMKG